MSAARARPSLGCMHDHAPGLRGASNRRLLTLSLIITASVMIVQIVGAARARLREDGQVSLRSVRDRGRQDRQAFAQQV